MANEMILQKNTAIYNPGQPVRVIGIIKSGSIIMNSDYFSLTLPPGQVMGLLHLKNGTAFTTDITTEDTVLSAYRLENTYPDVTVLQDNHRLQKAALETINCQMSSLITQYKQYKDQLKSITSVHTNLTKKYTAICEKLHVASKIPNSDVPTFISDILKATPYIIPYYTDFNLVLEQHSENFVSENHYFVYGLIQKALEDVLTFKEHIDKLATAIIFYRDLYFHDSYNDYFRYFSELVSRTHPGTEEYINAKSLVTSLYTCLNQMPFVDKAALSARMDDQQKKMPSQTIKETVTKIASEPEDSHTIQDHLLDSMNKILAAADEDEEFVSSFTKHIFVYKELTDKSSTASNVSQLRHQLTADFLRLYKNLALKYVHGDELDDTVKMFLIFGYIDENLAGMQNAEVLYKLLYADIAEPEENIFTFIEWLQAIYDGKREPSRNEFDMDYTDFLRSERVAGKISSLEEKALAENADAKVMYELDNFFPQANKMTFGHISTYCPFFSSHNLIDKLGKNLLGATKLMQERENIRRIDYQIFYKEIVYSNPSIGINAEFIHKEILPDIILMPNYGARGIMWQEVEGKKRATPCRMVLPLFTPENLRTMFLRVCGEYRWEMCKRTQGSHWNDPSSHSLTGDYFDYLQFYRKNNDLSADAKEKVKVLLTKARNSIKEAFVLDYLIWIMYESEGSPRLNKVARSILFNHCPFPLATRQKLTSNPIYVYVVQKHTTKYEQLSHRASNLCLKVSNAGKNVPAELQQEVTFFDK